MWAQNILLAVIGLSAGVIVASGLFSFVIELGVVSDFVRPHPHRRTHFALRGQRGAGWNTGEYFLGVSHIHTRWEYIGRQCSGFLVEYLWDAGRWHLQKC